MKNDYIKIPKSFVFSKNLKQYDFKAMRLYFDSILKGMGDTTESKEYLLKKKIREDKNKLCKFVEVVSTIHFYRYKQDCPGFFLVSTGFTIYRSVMRPKPHKWYRNSHFT